MTSAKGGWFVVGNNAERHAYTGTRQLCQRLLSPAFSGFGILLHDGVTERYLDLKEVLTGVLFSLTDEGIFYEEEGGGGGREGVCCLKSGRK